MWLGRRASALTLAELAAIDAAAHLLVRVREGGALPAVAVEMRLVHRLEAELDLIASDRHALRDRGAAGEHALEGVIGPDRREMHIGVDVAIGMYETGDGAERQVRTV